MEPRRILLELLDAALRAVDGRARVASALEGREIATPITAFAIGKAASSMLLGARDILGPRLERALLITKDGHVDPALTASGDVTVLESAHPVPDQRSLAAGAALIRAVQALREHDFPLFLVSGGSSALVESLAEGVSLEKLQELNRSGLAAGWDIARLNAERSRLSLLKGGGVARLLGAREALALLVSDVLTDDPDIIGSGLLGSWPGHRDRIARIVVASVDHATTGVVEAARDRGLDLQVLPGHIQGDVEAVASDFLEALRRCEGDGLVWGGESTVKLTAQHGRGGRNQHLALWLARQLRVNEDLTILAAGTDGTDGGTGDAGAIVDSGTISRAELGGVDVERAWRGFDSGLALEAAEDLIHTGPTGTNVGDILIGLRRGVNRVHGSAAGRML